VLAIPLPILAVEIGWMTAEVGRQPWIVYGLMMTDKGVSPGVSAGDVLLSLGTILVVYSLLFFLWLYSLRKEIIRGPGSAPGVVEAPATPPAGTQVVPAGAAAAAGAAGSAAASAAGAAGSAAASAASAFGDGGR